jgi:hypothetical protein
MFAILGRPPDHPPSAKLMLRLAEDDQKAEAAEAPLSASRIGWGWSNVNHRQERRRR